MSILLLNLIFSIQTVFAHGEIEIIECHNKDNNMILRGEPVKKGSYTFKVLDHADVKNEYEGVKLKMTDTLKGKQVIELIDFRLGKSPVQIKIIETPFREVREGSCDLNLPSFKGKKLNCYAVY